MEMPKLKDAHVRLQALAGDWVGEEIMPPSQWVPTQIAASAKISNRSVAAGFALAQDYEQRQGDRVSFAGHGVFWVEPDGSDVRLHWWDGFGMRPEEFRGRWEADRLVLESHGVMGHTRGTWVLGDNAYDHMMETSRDGANWAVVMRGTYRRR